jgi:predicted DNA-binding transcriptional regulator AlpA
LSVRPEDLLDVGEVAELLGLSRKQGVHTYRDRYPDFPEPVVVKASGKCVLWLRQDIERWDAGRRRQRGPVPGAKRE